MCQSYSPSHTQYIYQHVKLDNVTLSEMTLGSTCWTYGGYCALLVLFFPLLVMMEFHLCGVVFQLWTDTVRDSTMQYNSNRVARCNVLYIWRYLADCELRFFFFFFTYNVC